MVHIESLIIEATRQCALNCAHCLRGDSEARSFSAFGKLEKFLKQGVSIDSLIFSGGEPFLVPEVLLHIINIMLKYETHVSQIYIATSGVIPNSTIHLQNIILTLHKMLELLKVDGLDILYESDAPSLLIELSNSEYHAESREQLNLKIEPLLALISKKDSRTYKESSLIPIGRAEYLGMRHDKYDAILKSCEKGIEINIDDEEDEVNIPEMYITFDGRCFPECDLSYDMMDDADAYEFKVYTLDEITKIIKKDLRKRNKV